MCTGACAQWGTVRQESWRNPVKVYKVDIALDHTDAGVMRPAMRFRAVIETGRTPGLLLAPRDAVFLREAVRSCGRAAPWAGARCPCGSSGATGARWRSCPA